MSLNNNGVVAFHADFLGGQGVFTQNALLAQTGGVISGRTLTSIDNSPSINDSGTVAFTAGYEGSGLHEGVFTQNTFLAGPGSVITGRTLVDVDHRPAINESGLVAFQSDLGSGTEGIFTQNALLAVTGQVIDGRAIGAILNRDPALNDAGEVAFAARFTQPGQQEYGFFTQNRFLTGVESSIDGLTLTGLDGAPSLNNDGTIAFRGDVSGPNGHFTQDRLLRRIGDSVDGATLLGFLDHPSLNNAGEIAIFARFSEGGSMSQGLFTSNSLVARSGQVVGGKTLDYFYGGDFALNGPPALNDRGQIAFTATFADGTNGIVLATPVPEPGTWALMSLGTAALLLFRRTRVWSKQ